MYACIDNEITANALPRDMEINQAQGRERKREEVGEYGVKKASMNQAP